MAHGSLFNAPTQQQKDDLKEAAQLQYDECAKKLEASRLVLADVKADAAAQQSIVDGLQKEVDALHEAKALESQIAAQLFEGKAGDAEENKLEAAVHAALPKLEQARADVANYNAVKEKVMGAQKKFEQAQLKWDDGMVWVVQCTGCTYCRAQYTHDCFRFLTKTQQREPLVKIGCGSNLRVPRAMLLLTLHVPPIPRYVLFLFECMCGVFTS